MKIPPGVEIIPEKEDKKVYLYGDEILFGFPNRTYFELYNGACSSDKIFSVQRSNYVEDAVAVIYHPEDNVNVDLKNFADKTAVGHQHIFVEYSADLSNYLDDMGIKSEVTYYADCENKSAGNSVYKNAAFVNPKAFEWLTQDQVEELFPDSNQDEGEQTKKSNKVIIAALIAAISLLN